LNRKNIGEEEPVILLVVQGWKRRKYYFKPRRGATYTTFAGVLRGEDIIGKPWGFTGKLGKARYYLLPPLGPELIENFGRRGGQVIYSKDSAYIAYKSGIRPGSRVFEAGVGSGFLTIALASIVCPNGMIYGLDLRADMLEKARENIRLAGYEECVTLRLGDITNGIGVEELDAGFLDMPDPWRALQPVYTALKPGATLVVFLPTANQLVKMVERVEEHGGYVIHEIDEILLREWEPTRGAVKPSPRMIGHTGFVLFLRKIIIE